MALNSIGTFLMQNTGTSGTPSWEKLIDIKTQPAMGGDREQLETTTLSNYMRTYIPGIEGNDQKNFTANYDKTAFETLKALKDQELDLAVWFGGTQSGGEITPTGTDGKFAFKGYVDVYANENDVNVVREMTVNVTVSSEIAFS